MAEVEFIEWHNPPNRPSLSHIKCKDKGITLCGAEPKGNIATPIIARKEYLCKQCIINYDRMLYHDSCGYYVDWLLDKSQNRFGVSVY